MANTREGAPSGSIGALHRAWPDLPWEDYRLAHGAFHVVVVLRPTAVVRIRSGADHARHTAREARAAKTLGAAGLDVPQPLREPFRADEWSAAAYAYVPGAAVTPSTWSVDRRLILPLLETWADAGNTSTALRHALAPVRTWCGGAEWPDVVGRITARTDARPGLYRAAADCVREVVEAERDAPVGLVHGDFGPHNILVDEGGSGRPIDPDNAAWADPAIDAAPLLARYDLGDLARDLDRGALRRATIHRRSLPLQVAAGAELVGDGALRDHALDNFARRNLRC